MRLLEVLLVGVQLSHIVFHVCESVFDFLGAVGLVLIAVDVQCLESGNVEFLECHVDLYGVFLEVSGSLKGFPFLVYIAEEFFLVSAFAERSLRADHYDKIRYGAVPQFCGH